MSPYGRQATRPEGAVEPREGYQYRDAGKCKGCGAPMIWWETPAGKLSPHDLDGTSHFATCPLQERFRKQREVE
jgi:hypothetical protein